MSIGSFFERLFGGAPRPIDYTPLSDARLVELVRTRSTLTDEARHALDAEIARRGLEIPKPKWKRAAPEPIADFPPLDPIVFVENGGVALLVGERRAVLFVFPLRREGHRIAPMTVPDTALEVRAIISLDGTGEGALATEWFADRFAGTCEAVYTLDVNAEPRRFPGTEKLPAVHRTLLPERFELGLFSLARAQQGSSTLIARWTFEGRAIHPSVAIGLDVRFEDVVHARAEKLLGGIALDEENVRADSGPLAHVFIVNEAVGASADAMGAIATERLFAHAARVAPKFPALPPELVAASWEGRWDDVDRALHAATDFAVEEAMTSLLAAPNGEAPAQRLMELACTARPSSGSRWFGRAAIAYMRGANDEAIALYTRAASAELPEPRAWANLAAIHIEHDRPAEALRAAEAAHAAMPYDLFSLQHLLLALVALGRRDDALAVLDALGDFPLDVPRSDWDAFLGAVIVSKRATYPTLAEAAYRASLEHRRVGDVDAVIATLRRCMELQRSHRAGALELGRVLVGRGRIDEARAHLAMLREAQIDVAALERLLHPWRDRA